MSAPTVDVPSRIVSYNPATGDLLGDVPNMDAAGVAEALARARAAQRQWAQRPAIERAQAVARVGCAVTEAADEVAGLLSRETGKPMVEARAAEVFPVCYFAAWLGKNAPRFLARREIDIGIMKFLGKRSYIEFKPLGVAAVITPWNYPFSIAMGEILTGLAAGNAVLNKPSEHTPLIALKTRELCTRAGIPEDLFQVLTGDGRTGAALVDAGADKVFFTGSVRTGKRIAEACARRLTPYVLELGGKDPMIVLEDANLKNAARGAVWAAFSNSGQTCASVERCYVHESVHDRFVDLVLAETTPLRQGWWGNGTVDVGPMNNDLQFQIVKRHMQAAREEGGRIRTGGEPNAQAGPLFFQPTVITGVTQDMTCVREETFGPTLPILTFRSDDEAVQLANDSPYGLTASVWSRSRERAWEMAQRLVAGTVTINDHMFSHAACETPWMGAKDSGVGVTHSQWGIEEFCRKQHINVGKASTKVLWWFPYSAGLDRALGAAHQAAFGRGVFHRVLSALRAAGALMFGGRK